jgi:hypothetical protein
VSAPALAKKIYMGFLQQRLLCSNVIYDDDMQRMAMQEFIPVQIKLASSG